MEQIKNAARAVLEADALLIFTGAGMGVDSGLGTFRGTTLNPSQSDNLLNARLSRQDETRAFGLRSKH